MLDVTSIAHSGTSRTFQIFVCQYDKLTVQKQFVSSEI